jgi:transmembrane sensor
MQPRTVIQLLALKLSGEATQNDLAELEDLIAKHPEAVYHEELLKQLFYNKAEDLDTDYYYNRHRLKYQDKLVFAEQTVSAFDHFKLTTRFYAVCSLLLIVAMAGFFAYHYKNLTADTRYNTRIISGQRIHKSLLLPDGTKVWLNSDSKLEYDKDMNRRSTRSVHLIGEAYFDVAHDKVHPFIIRTDKISVKVLGTAFNVKAYPTDNKTETTLLRGSIELSLNNGNAEKVILKPSEKFALIDNKRKAPVYKSSTQNETGITMMIQNITPVKVAGKEYTEEVSWVNNELVFNNETFEELVPKLERWYNIKLEIQKEEINDYHFTGVFTHESLTEALTAMKLIKSFNFKIKDYDVIIY